MIEFRTVVFPGVYANLKLRARTDGKPHLCFRQGWWYCTAGTPFHDAVIMFGQTPEHAYECAIEMRNDLREERRTENRYT